MQENSNQVQDAHSYENILKKLQERYPICISRQEVEIATGGLISRKRLANLDSEGKGPNGRVRFNRKTGYLIEAFCKWFTDHLKAE